MNNMIDEEINNNENKNFNDKIFVRNVKKESELKKEDINNHNDKIVSEKEITKKPIGLSFEQYLAAGAFGFSIAMFITLAVLWVFFHTGVEITFIFSILIALIPNITGSAVASFLFTRKTRINYFKDGVKIGIAGAIITFIMSLIMSSGIGGAYIIIGFIIGGLLGGFVSKKTIKHK